MTNKLPKIAFFVEYLSIVGGIENLITQLSNVLTHKGYKIEIYVLRESALKKPRFTVGDNVKLIYCDYNWVSHNNKYKRLRQLKDIKILLSKCDADIIVGNNTGINLSLCFKPKSCKAKTIAIQHFSGKILGPWKFLNAIFFRKLDKFVVLTNKTKKYYEKLGMKNCICIPNFFTYSIQQKNLPTSKQSNKCITIANFLDWKHIDFIINSFKYIKEKIPDASLDIYGGGPEKNFLSSLICSNNLSSSIKVYGYTKNVIDKLINAKVFLFASDNTEAFGMSQVEAISCGVPVVAADNDASRYVLRNCGTITKRDTKIFAKEVINILTDDNIYNKKVKKALYQSKEFSLEAVITKWEKLFLEYVPKYL